MISQPAPVLISPNASDLNHPSHSNFGGVVELVESEQWLTWLIA
jgi:hypothetical protein